MAEIDQPLTELCERAWKLLHRLGRKSNTNPRSNGGHDVLMSFKFEGYHVWSKNRFLRISKDTGKQHWGEPIQTTVFSVTEDGEIGSLDIVECSIALERFRQYTILDDLAEASDL